MPTLGFRADLKVGRAHILLESEWEIGMTRRRRRKQVTLEDALGVCAWCGKQIPEGSEVFSIGARFRPGVEVEHERNVIELALTPTRKALAIVPTEDSEARRAGYDLLFVLCSEECGTSLRRVLQGQIDIFESRLGA